MNHEISSPNSVPFVAEESGIVFTCGARDGKWTIEAADWESGETAFHYVLGGSKFNTIGAGITVDEDGHLLFGSMYGHTRIKRGPGARQRGARWKITREPPGSSSRDRTSKRSLICASMASSVYASCVPARLWRRRVLTIWSCSVGISSTTSLRSAAKLSRIAVVGTLCVSARW